MVERPYHHENLREALLERGLTEVEIVGAEGLSLRGLARDLAVSHMAPARHFANRQVFLDALAQQGFQQLIESLEGIQGAPASYVDRFRGLGRAYLDFALKHPNLLGLMYERKHSPGAVGAREVSQQASAIVYNLIRGAQDQGQLGPGDTAELALVAFMAVQGLASMAVGGFTAGAETDALLDTLVTVLWVGMGGRPHA